MMHELFELKKLSLAGEIRQWLGVNGLCPLTEDMEVTIRSKELSEPVTLTVPAVFPAPEMKDKFIKELNLPTLIKNALEDRGILTLGQLALTGEQTPEGRQPWGEIIGRNIAHRGYCTIRSTLEDLGLRLSLNWRTGIDRDQYRWQPFWMKGCDSP